MDLLSATRNHIGEFTLNTKSFSVSRNRLTISIEFTLSPLSYSQISDESTICIANSLWIRYSFPDCTWIHYFFREFAINSLSFRPIQYWFRGLNFNWLFWENYKFTTCFTNNLWIIYIFWIHYFFMIRIESVIFFANKLWILYLFRKFTINTISISRIH